HRDEEIACEKIRVEVAKRRRDTQLSGGDPAVCFAPFQTTGRKTFDRFLQVQPSHRIGVDAHVLREETRQTLETSAVQIEVGIRKGSDQKRTTSDEEHRCSCA